MASTYTTVQGDKWDSIAYRQLGSDSYTWQIMQMNGRYLGYYIFPAGIVLKLPDAQAEAVTPATLPPWKQANG